MERPHRASGRRIALMLAAIVAASEPASACDVCAVYTATDARLSQPGPWVAVAEQFTHFGTLRRDGDQVPNPAGERINSSITQLVAGYTFTPRLTAQLNLPVITRHFRRLEGGRVVQGAVSGFGDLSLLGQILVHHVVTAHSVFRFSVLGGLELPSGNPSPLAEEDADHAESGGSGVHGHDLALGSGSVDGIVGAQLFWSWDRLYVTASGQYAIRTVGAFDYRYANDLMWSAGPGVFALATHEYSLGLQAVFSGEIKGNDQQQGRQLDDTAITALFLGPRIAFTWRTNLAAEAGVDLPVLQHDTGLQIMPDYRVRAGLSWRF